MKRLLLASALCLAIAGTAFGQSIYSSIRGQVADSGGGTIANAKVSLVNEATNDIRTTVTSASGEYSFTQVIPSGYMVIVESPGFKKFERKNILLETQQAVTVDIKMEVGQVTESVLVTEEVPLIETATASQGQVIDRQKLVDLPNLGRNPYMFSRLAPNVVQVGNPGYMRMQDQSGSSQISIAGGPVRGNNYLLDGVPITDMNNRAIIIASLEAVQEMKVQANTYDAEIGRSGGGMFNAFLKSGSNDFHGSIGGYFRQTDWLANSFFSNRRGLPRTEQPFRNYLGSFGGPIWIPKVYDGRNRTFFWISAEGYRDTQANAGTTAVPTELERAGNFSGSGRDIFDPLGTLAANGDRTPFAGRIIPASRIDPVGRAIAATFAKPSVQGTAFGEANVTYTAQLPSTADQHTVKFDHKITSWWNASLSYLWYHSLEPGETWFPDSPSSPQQWRLDRIVNSTQVNNTLTINPTTVATVRYGFNRFPNYSFQLSQGFNPGSLGFNSAFTRDIGSPTFPRVQFENFYAGDAMGTNSNSLIIHHSKNLNASISKYVGRHSIKAGGDWRRLNVDGIDFGNGSGNFTFTDIFTRQNINSRVGGADVASLLLGYPASATGFLSTKLFQYVTYFSGFMQDDIRINNKLTVNVGLRWERESGLRERNNNIIVGFERNALNSLSTQVGTPVRGAVQFAGLNGARHETSNLNQNKLSPRIGLAYAINNKTTIRGGYGIFWAPAYGLGGPYLSEGITATTEPAFSADNGRTPLISLNNPFPTGLVRPAGNTRGDATGLGIGLTIFDPNARSTWVQQYSFDVQRELPGGVALSVAYVGSRTRNLTLNTAGLSINQLEPRHMALGTAALNAPTRNPFYVAGGRGVLANEMVGQNQLLRPFPAFSNLTYSWSDQNRARYDSLVVRAQKRLSRGLTFLVAWTYSKNLDQASGGAGNNLNGGNVGAQNVYDLGAEYSLSYLHSPHRLSMAYTYELPFGKGKAMLSGANPVVNYIVGGWSLNAVGILQTGYPLQIRQLTNLNGNLIFSASQRPNATGQPVRAGSTLDNYITGVPDGADPRTAPRTFYLSKNAFSQAGALTFGNVARTIPVYSLGQVNWDISMFKTFSIREKIKAQIRAEFLNATNTPFFRAPNVTFGSPTFGQITSQANFSRMIQLGIRGYF
jgi:hypothetical protein